MCNYSDTAKINSISLYPSKHWGWGMAIDILQLSSNNYRVTKMLIKVQYIKLLNELSLPTYFRQII